MSYIFFYENYDIYKTEQLCANLYKLMEMIFISIKLNKTLVLPNFYMTPRNNELIGSLNELIIDRIELIDIRNILCLDKLKEICNCISITDYMKLKNLETIIISKPNEDIPIIDEKYHTIYGVKKIKKHLIQDYSSLNILNVINNYNKMNDLMINDIIIHNYNRMGNPIWSRNELKDEYYTIRNTLKFNNELIEKSNKIIEGIIKDKGIDFNNLLLVHWRRGDFKLNIADTEETKSYYQKYNKLNELENLIKNILLRCYENKLTNILLITNETNDNELLKLTNILTEFNINTTIFDASDNNSYLKYLISDICSIIIGSKCKYQLHGFGNYDRMSQYGRWIIEENMSCVKYFLE